MDLEVLGSSPRGGTISAPASSIGLRSLIARDAVSILGGGVVGLVLGLRLARAGRLTTIVDPAPVGVNASGVAAGMLAPASEALETQASNFERLHRARDLWSGLGSSAGITLDRSGAVHAWSAASPVEGWESLRAAGARMERIDLPTWTAAGLGGEGLWTPDDWRLEPHIALPALRQAFLAAGGRWIQGHVTSLDDADEFGERAQIVVAMGWGAAACVGLAPELARLCPIKGQILRFGGGARSGPVLRHRGLYLAPSSQGLVVGATMEHGRSDLTLHEERLDELQRAAAEIAPALADTPRTAAAGVRAATPDGWPLVGRSSTGVWLSVGARRNGWLLAPLMAEVMHAGLDGREHPDARAFAPTRFDDRVIP